jgi:uncharacterized protein YdiU (UPF0061 family)
MTPLKKLTDLPWDSRFVREFPGDPESRNFTRPVQKILYSGVLPTPVKSPKLIGWADRLAEELGIQRPESGDPAIEVLAGNRVLPLMRPYAARYGGHQFGQWAGQLGDGRAITLGEATTPRGRFEFQLKGAGPTPYSRRADGRAVLRSSVREFLCSEAMHFLGVPTTRALSLVVTGEEVVRDMFYDGNPREEPGAVVCRVAPSFLRFGNFEILAASEEFDLLKKLADFVVTEYYPEIDPKDPDVYGRLLDEVARRTARMISHWMRVGFVHGVMNTDNMSILGVTIDYGPYGWLEPYDPDWTPNTTDAEGRRYRFGNQPAIALWNVARLCEAFFPLVRDEGRLHVSLGIFKETFESTHTGVLLQKLGLDAIEAEKDAAWINGLFELLEATETDYTLFFRALSNWKVVDPATSAEDEDRFLELIAPAFYAPDAPDPELRTKWKHWARVYTERLRTQGIPEDVRHTRMKLVNPKYVLRNYLAQNVIQAAEKGDLSVLERLLRVLETPYDEHPAEENLAAKRPEWARTAPGCSSLSCSS